MARFGCTITVDTGKMPSSQTDFTWLATEDNFPTAAIDGGGTSIDNGGGNLRCYTDDTKATQLPIEVVSFVTGGTPSVQVWGLSGTLNVASTVYIEADEVATTQPAVGAAFGRNAVWVDYLIVSHLNIDGTTTSGAYINSTGGSDGTGVSMSLPTIAGPHSNNAADFDGSNDFIKFPVSLSDTDDVFTISVWGKCSDLSTDQRLAGFYQIGNTNAASSILWMDADGSGDGWRAQGRSSTGGISTVGSDSHDNATTNWQMLQQRYGVSTHTLRVDGTQTQQVGAVGNFSSPTNKADEVRVGRMWDTTTYFNGGISTLAITMSELPDDYLDSEYNNQSDPSTFWTVGAWEDQDAGGGRIMGSLVYLGGLTGSGGLTGRGGGLVG